MSTPSASPGRSVRVYPPLAALCWFLSVTQSPSAVGAETVRDARLGISFTLPDGFVPVPDELRIPQFPYSFGRDLEQPERAIIIRVRGSGGRTLSGDTLSPDDISLLGQQIPSVERFSEDWQGRRMDGIKVNTTDADGLRRVHYALPISTKPEAVLIWVSGPSTRDAVVRGHLNTVMQTFESTPISSSAPASGLALKNKHLVLAGLIALMVALLIVARVRRRRVPPPATN